MKTVSGKIESSKPISLSKAARILSKFASSDNGASPAFAAYLRRTSTSFGELVQLHKELKGSSPERKGKKHRPDGTLTEEAVCSVKKPREDGLETDKKQQNDETKKHKAGKRDEREGRELKGCQKTNRPREHKIKRDEGELSSGSRADMPDDVEKLKRKKKRDTVEIVAIPVKDKMCDDLNFVHANEVKNDLESQDGNKETKKKKKKRRIDEDEKIRGNGFAEIEKEEQSHSHNQDSGSETTEMVPDDGWERKKSEKVVKKKESGGIEGVKQRNLSDDDDRDVKNEISIANNAGGDEKKHMKRFYGGEETRSGGEVELQEAHKKDSRKKHSERALGGLDNSPESRKQRKRRGKVS